MAKHKKKTVAKNRHHRKCKINQGNNSVENISIVPVHKHRAFHILFGTACTHEIARILTEIWIDPRFKLVVERRE